MPDRAAMDALADTAERAAIRDAVRALCERFGDSYWEELDRTATFPHAFHRAVADAGWLGIAMPEAYGGAGLGICEAAILMQTVANSGGAFAACSAIHMNIFGPHAIVVHGTAAQKQRMLPPLIRGEVRACFGVTEPDAGLDTTRLTTRASREGGGYVVHGRKIWTSTAQVAQKIVLLARTTTACRCSTPTSTAAPSRCARSARWAAPPSIRTRCSSTA